MRDKFEIASEWVHLRHQETSLYKEVYGFAGSQGIVNLEGVRLTPRGRPSKTLVVMMHPATSLQILPVPPALAAAGASTCCVLATATFATTRPSSWRRCSST